MFKQNKILRIIFSDNDNFSLEYMLFLSSIILGILACLFGTLINVILYTSFPAVFFPLLLSIMLIIFYFFLKSRSKIEPYIFSINTIAIIGITLIWILNGGIDGSNIMPALIILVIALITVTKNKRKYILALFLGSFLIAYLIQFFQPGLITKLPSETSRWIDSLVTLIYTAFFFFFLVMSIHKYYDIEKIKTKKSEEKYRTIFENVQDVFYQVDHSGIIMEISPSVKSFSEYERDELINKSITMLYDNPEDRIILLDIIVKEDELVDREVRFKTKSGKIKYASINARIIKDNSENHYHIEGVFRDITHRKKVELELIHAKEKAEESDNLKTAFLANLSHEIRTPMNSIMGFASLLPDEQDKNLISYYSNIIVKNSEQLVHVIDDIVLYSRLQSKQLSLYTKKFDVHQLLLNIKQSFDLPEYKKKGVELYIETFTENPIFVISDIEKIWQIYANLISNAFKYTSVGAISFGIANNENEHLFFVKDSGMGIPSNEIDKIFDRFYRGSNVNQGVIGGTGIGLSIVKELVGLIGGKIWLESKVGVGSTFYFSIPNAN